MLGQPSEALQTLAVVDPRRHTRLNSQTYSRTTCTMHTYFTNFRPFFPHSGPVPAYHCMAHCMQEWPPLCAAPALLLLLLLLLPCLNSCSRRHARAVCACSSLDSTQGSIQASVRLIRAARTPTFAALGRGGLTQLPKACKNPAAAHPPFRRVHSPDGRPRGRAMQQQHRTNLRNSQHTLGQSQLHRCGRVRSSLSQFRASAAREPLCIPICAKHLRIISYHCRRPSNPSLGSSVRADHRSGSGHPFVGIELKRADSGRRL